jgi:hypothetical protein
MGQKSYDFSFSGGQISDVCVIIVFGNLYLDSLRKKLLVLQGGKDNDH